jgi:hypothetical protein
MVKTPMYGEVALSDALRRKRSDAEKRKRGEERVTLWLSPDAARALAHMTRGDKSRGAKTEAVNYALITTAQNEGMKVKGEKE